jgi:two-component system phosphate regulon sensor histidine kinase PhoR
VAETGDLQDRLRAAEALLANVPDPVLLVGREGSVREANPAARALLPTLRIGQPLSYGLRAPDILDGIAAANSGASVNVEYRTRAPGERVFDVQITPLAAADDAGPLGTMLFFRDLTEARRVERMRVDFIANVSHELRTPLASVVGFIETLQGPARQDEAARERFLTIMQAQAGRMTRLIDDLLSLSRIELREHVAPSAEVDLNGVAAQMIDTLSSMAADRGVEIALESEGGPFAVWGDRDELLRLVENLVENAIKYGERGGQVRVVLGRRDGDIELTVRDNGPGIAPEHLPRLTERFYRIDAAESREKGGTGLGLAIVKHIVNRHRGRLKIESEPGHGATFTASFPQPHGPYEPAKRG